MKSALSNPGQGAFHIAKSIRGNMDSIIRGTTPTIKYTFKTVSVSDITTAYLTVKSTTDLEKTLEQATVGEDFLAWTFTQEESLAFGDKISCMLNWLTSDGLRGASVKTYYGVIDNDKNEII